MNTSEAIRARLDQFRADFHLLRDERGKVIVSQSETVEGTRIALIAGGYVLLDDFPGLGKTLLVRLDRDGQQATARRTVTDRGGYGSSAVAVFSTP